MPKPAETRSAAKGPLWYTAFPVDEHCIIKSVHTKTHAHLHTSQNPRTSFVVKLRWQKPSHPIKTHR